jgi:uncharacterized membrane-anchored protein YitT (DUF2179 family)
MRLNLMRWLPWPGQFSWSAVRDFSFILVGAFIQALSLRLFLVPSQLVIGGVSGLSQVINYHTGWPIGLMIFIGNVPLFALGWKFLGGPRFALRTAFAVASISIFTDLLVLFLPSEGITTDLVLNVLYGAVMSGTGYGLVYRGYGTSGGSDILARILNHWRSVPISQSYLMVDSLVIFLAGLSFGWDKAMYALVLLYMSGVVAEVVVAGSNVTRTAMIVTNFPEAVSSKILHVLKRGVTMLSGTGAYTGAERSVLYCVVSRGEVNQLKTLVREADPNAFMVIGQAQEALGAGFLPLSSDK